MAPKTYNVAIIGYGMSAKVSQNHRRQSIDSQLKRSLPVLITFPGLSYPSSPSRSRIKTLRHRSTDPKA